MDLFPVNVEFLRYLKKPALCRLVCGATCNLNSEETISSCQVLSSEKNKYIPLKDAVKFKMEAETSSVVVKRDIS